MAKEKSDSEPVVVWENTSGRYLHRDSDAGGEMFKPGAAQVMTEAVKRVKGAPPSNITEKVMSRGEARKRYGEKAVQGD